MGVYRFKVKLRESRFLMDSYRCFEITKRHQTQRVLYFFLRYLPC